MTYTNERFEDSKAEKLSLSTVGRELQEMSPQQKARYNEDYQRRREEYQKKTKEFSHNFATKTDQYLYLLSIKTKEERKLTVLNTMRKDRASKQLREEHR